MILLGELQVVDSPEAEAGVVGILLDQGLDLLDGLGIGAEGSLYSVVLGLDELDVIRDVGEHLAVSGHEGVQLVLLRDPGLDRLVEINNNLLQILLEVVESRRAAQIGDIDSDPGDWLLVGRLAQSTAQAGRALVVQGRATTRLARSKNSRGHVRKGPGCGRGENVQGIRLLLVATKQ